MPPNWASDYKPEAVVILVFNLDRNIPVIFHRYDSRVVTYTTTDFLGKTEDEARAVVREREGIDAWI